MGREKGWERWFGEGDGLEEGDGFARETGLRREMG